MIPKLAFFTLTQVKEQPSMNRIILGEISIADREKRATTWAEAADFLLPNAADGFDFCLRVFLNREQLCMKLQRTLESKYGARKDTGWNESFEHQGLGDGRNLMDWDASSSIRSTCVKVGWRTPRQPLSGETGGWREAHLLTRLSLWYLVNVIINTVI